MGTRPEKLPLRCRKVVPASQWTSGDLQRVSVSEANVFEADMRKADFLRAADLLT
jgi:hypothetical protein